MSPLKGVRVVRGPDWKYGDQDGGEGYVGTVIDSSDLNYLGPKTVTVIWDTGVKAQYRSGPEGSYDLRIASNVAVGVKHPNILCADCGIKEICGTRWQCVTCHINLCSSCFFKEAPHNQEHNQFKRYDNDIILKPPIVSSWIGDGPQSRIALKGTFNGAKVVLRGQKDLSRFGMVIPDPEAELSGKIAVKWAGRMKKCRIYYDRCKEGELVFEMVEVGIGGFFYPEALPPLYTPFVNSLVLRPLFCVGDRVCIDPEIKMGHEGFAKEMEELKGVAGTVESLIDSELLVDYKEKEKKLRLNPATVKKLNKFSLNQVVRIRSDEATIREIEVDFGSRPGFERIDGSVGRVSGIVESDPEMLYIQLDEDKFFKWLPKDEFLPSRWMEHFETQQPSVEEEIVELVSKVVTLFINAVNRGDIRVAKLLYNRAGVDVDARNPDGRTALHVACQQGHKEIVEWLLYEAGTDLEVADKEGFRALHHAVIRCNPEIVEILIKTGAELNSQNHSGRSALHLAVMGRFKECSLLLIQQGSNVNLQDSEESTPLHCALESRAVEMIEILIASGRIDWTLGTNKKPNVLQLAIGSNVDGVIECLLKDFENLLFNWTSSAVYPGSPIVGSTALHLAGFFRNIKVSKLLLGHLKVQKELLGSCKFDHFLDMRNESGSTALLIACRKKSIAIIELLVEAGANVKSLDEEGNSAIIHVASSMLKDEIPTQDLCPSIFNQFMSNGNKLMELHPILPLISYLLFYGCPWDTVNKAGKRATDILLERGYPKDVIENLNATAAKWKRWIPGPNGCMGQNGACPQQAVLGLYCSHKATFHACNGCFAFKERKCGCDDEDVISVRPLQLRKDSEKPEKEKEAEEPEKMKGKDEPPKEMEDPPKEVEKEDPKKQEEERVIQQRIVAVKDENQRAAAPAQIQASVKTGGLIFTWISNGQQYGYIEDQLGQRYNWNKRTRMDGGIGYKCAFIFDHPCSAVVRRYLKGDEEHMMMERPHNHPTTNKRKLDFFGGSPGMPAAKQSRV